MPGHDMIFSPSAHKCLFGGRVKCRSAYLLRMPIGNASKQANIVERGIVAKPLP